MLGSTADGRISKIIEYWFLSEPALFGAVCTHDLVENPGLECIMRCGQRRIEYNPDQVCEISDGTLEEALKTEAVRILLKHPYERRPDNCCGEAISLGSNVCIGSQYVYKEFKIETPEDFSLEIGQTFEWYAWKFQELMDSKAGIEGAEGADGSQESSAISDEKSQGGSQGASGDTDNDSEGSQEGSGSSDEKDKDSSQTDAENSQQGEKSDRNRIRELSDLWDEDDVMVSMINEVIESTQDWGSLAGSLAERIKASTKAKISWRKVLSGFRASILSSKRKLTRMRPNRRSGFEQMGSIRRFDTRLLIAVDVSGSISTMDLEYFFGVINSAFTYGFETIDVIQFDYGITQVQNLKRKMKNVTATGRGGTSFQEPIDFAHQNKYDGLLILTDGYAPEPVLPDNMRCKIVWVCAGQMCYDEHHTWMEKSGRVCAMEIH